MGKAQQIFGGQSPTPTPTPVPGAPMSKAQEVFSAPIEQTKAPAQPKTFFDNAVDFLAGTPEKDPLAIGVTPKGEEMYGEGFEGWLRKTAARFFDPAKRSEGISYERQQQIEEEARQAAQAWAGAGEGREDWKGFYQAGTQAGLLNKERAAKGEGVSVALGELGQAARTAIVDVGIMGLLQLGDIATRKVGAASEGLEDIANATSTIPQWNPYEQNKAWVERNMPQAAPLLNGLNSMGQEINPAGVSWNLLRYAEGQARKGDFLGAIGGTLAAPVALLSGPIGAKLVSGIAGLGVRAFGDAQEKAAVERNMRASNMLYTQMWDPLVKAQIMRELEAGTPVQVIEENLMNPWAELGGSLVLDPINFVGGGAAKGGKFLAGAENAAEVAPEVSKAFATLSDASKAADQVTAAKDAVLKASQIIDSKADDLAKMAGNYSPAAMTASGKSFTMSRVTGGFLKFLVGQFKDDPEQAAAVVREMARFAQAGDEAEKVRALAYLASVPGGERVFSNAGLATMAIMRKLPDPDSLARMAQAAASKGDDIAAKSENVAEWAAGLMDKAAKDLFPTVDEIKAADPERYKALPGYVKALNELAGRESAAGKLYRNLNSFFSTVYMGLSPAYAVRNALGNSVTMAVDMGIEKGAKSFFFQASNSFKPGQMLKRAQDNIAEMVGSLPVDLKSTETLATEAGTRFGALGVSERMEQAARTYIMQNAIAQEMDRAIRTTLPGVDGLRAAGMSDEQAAFAASLVQKHKGNMKKVEQEMREYLRRTGGVIEAQRLVQPSRKLRGFLQIYGLEKQLDEALSAPTLEQFNQQLDAIVKDMRLQAELASGEAARVAENSVEAGVIDGVVSGVKNTPLGRSLDAAFNHMAQSFRNAREAAYKTADDALNNLFAQAQQAGDWQTAQAISQAKTKLGQLQLEPLGQRVAGQIDAQRVKIRQLVSDVKGGNIPVENAIAQLDMQFPSGNQFKVSELFDTAMESQASFGDFIWNQYWPALSASWWGDFNFSQLAQAEGILNNLGLKGSDILAPVDELMREGVRLSDSIVRAKGDPNMINAAMDLLDEADMAGDMGYVNEMGEIVRRATEMGWKGGDRRILAAVNKDLAQKAKGITEALPGGLDAAITTPKKNLPLPLRKFVEDAVKQLESSLASGEAGKRAAAGAFGTTNPQWYRDLFAQGKGGRERIFAALDRIAEGKDKGAVAERLKEIGLGWIWDGDPISGTPPNLYLMQLTGATEEQIAKAAEAARDIYSKFYGRDMNPNEIMALDTVNSFWQAVDEATPQEMAAMNTRLSELAAYFPDDLAEPFNRFVELADKLGRQLGDKGPKYRQMGEITVEQATEALQKRGFDFTQPAAPRPFVRSAAQHSMIGATRENIDGFLKEAEQYKQVVAQNWNKPLPGQPVNRINAKKLGDWLNTAEDRMAKARQVALEVARAKADFVLHAYGDKTYLDTALAFVYPYHYWYGRTYKNWAQRAISSPATLAAYGKYRRTMEQLHAGLPDWWKYNLSTNDLPGVDMENPLYFNLEATLNPLNGLTGVDFHDGRKRVDWLSRTVDDMGKFGPSMFTPLSWLMSAYLYGQGEEEAATRWMGRLIPQSATVKAGLNMLGVQAPQIGQYGKYGEYDPFVNLFQGGLDPYERGRVGRALAALVQDGTITQEQAIDAANTQSGDVWDAAVNRATNLRAPGQMASYILGVGFKGRTNEDVQVDNFYRDYYQTMDAAANMPPETYREAMRQLAIKYPFMDAVLIARRADDDRNSAYAYNVLGRIPPGQSRALLDKAGITSEMMARFYDGKGTFKGWTQTDIQRFMAGVADMGALLAMPDGQSKQEWNEARNRWGNMRDAMAQQFGKDIAEKMDYYFGLEKEQQRLFIDAHPELQAAFDFQSQAYATDPVLYKYYGGIESLNKFYRSQMYGILETKYGADISAKWDEYYRLQIENATAAKQYYRAHPELAAYSKDKKTLQMELNRAVANLATYMPDDPTWNIRQDFQAQSQTQEEMLGIVSPSPAPSWGEWQAVLGPALANIVRDYIVSGEKLSSAAANQLEYMAGQYGFRDENEMIQAIGASINR